MDAEALVDTLADTLAEVESETLGDTLGDVEAEGLVNTLVVVYGIVFEFLIIVSGSSQFVVLGWNSNVVARILFVDCPSAIFMNPIVNNPTRLSHENNSEATAERVTEAVKETEISLKNRDCFDDMSDYNSDTCIYLVIPLLVIVYSVVFYCFPLI